MLRKRKGHKQRGGEGSFNVNTTEIITEFREQVEAEVKKHHSHETFVLQMIPITRLSKDASIWSAKVTRG